MTEEEELLAVETVVSSSSSSLEVSTAVGTAASEKEALGGRAVPEGKKESSSFLRSYREGRRGGREGGRKGKLTSQYHETIDVIFQTPPLFTPFHPHLLCWWGHCSGDSSPLMSFSNLYPITNHSSDEEG